MRMNLEPIKVAIIGYGYAAKTFHIPLLEASRYFQITDVYSSQKIELSEVNLHDDIDMLLEKTSASVVVITSPTSTHYSLVKKTLLADKHVVVEKPFVTKSNEGRELISLANEKALMLSVFHNRRWDNDFLSIKNMISEDKLGKIKFFESHFDRFRPLKRDRWRENKGEGSGILYDLGSHLIDQALTLFGRPKEILSDIGIQKESGETIDYFHLIFKYSNKLRVILHGSSFGDTAPRFQVQGDKKAFICQGLDPQEEQLKSGKNQLHPEYGKEDSSQKAQLIDWEKNKANQIDLEKGCYHEFYSNVYDHLSNSGELLVNAEKALEVVEVIEQVLADNS